MWGTQCCGARLSSSFWHRATRDTSSLRKFVTQENSVQSPTHPHFSHGNKHQIMFFTRERITFQQIASCCVLASNVVLSRSPSKVAPTSIANHAGCHGGPVQPASAQEADAENVENFWQGSSPRYAGMTQRPSESYSFTVSA